MQLTNAARLTVLRMHETDDCIEWTGGLTYSNYGRYTLDGVQTKAHRVSYLWTHGVMPEVVRHTCDNTKCINPRHLLAGTQGDNMKDMKERKRSSRYNKLTPEQVEEIKVNPATQVELARIYGVHQGTISRIKRGV